MNDPEAIVLTAEPVATVAQLKNNAITVIPLNDMYQEITGFNGFTQAGLFVNEKTIQEKPEQVKIWLELIRQSVEKCDLLPSEAAADAVAMGILPNESVALKAIPNCSIRYMTAMDAKEQIETTANIDLAQFGGSIPADDFYYNEE